LGRTIWAGGHHGHYAKEGIKIAEERRPKLETEKAEKGTTINKKKNEREKGFLSGENTRVTTKSDQRKGGEKKYLGSLFQMAFWGNANIKAAPRGGN